MKKLLAIFALLPLLSWAFPVYTNRLDFDPAQSTGAFDDFLWRWSGFDDQAVEFLFKDVTVSNVGFRLAYPQRGRTFLDVLPPKTTNTLVVVTNEVLDVYTNFYPAIYNRVTDRGFTNTTETLNYSNGVFLSRSVVTNSSKVGSVQNTTLALAASSVITTQSSAVATTTAYGPYTNAYVQSQNTTITITNNTEVTGWGVAPRVVDGLTLYPAAPQSGSFLVGAITNIFALPFTGTTYLTNISFSSSFSISSGNYYRVVAGGTSTNVTSIQVEFIPQSYRTYIQLNSSGFTLPFRATVTTNTFVGKLIITGQSNSILNLEYFGLQPWSLTNYSSSVSTNVVTLVATNVAEFYAPSTQRVSKIYSKTETPYSKVTFSVPRTNIPPDGPYFSEVLTYTAGGITNPSQSRTLAKGQVTIENSIYSITNYAGYTNYPGPWSYLLLDGSRPMAGNLNMGGNAVTNIGTNGLRFASGAYITPTDVATWNSFISSTSGLNAGTVFGGDVTGTYNNLTLRKNALDNMEFMDFTTAPTGTAETGRMVWNSGRETVRLGLNANVNLDMGQQLILYARNDETNTLSKGEVVYIAGAQGDNPTIKRASNASEALSARTIGIMAESVTVNNSGSVVTRGTIYGVNTTNFTQGANLYLGVNGTLQTNLPVAPTHGVFVGVVERVSANAGQIYVAIQNYQELEELSDVNVRGVATNDFIIWNGTVWTNYARTNLSGIYLPLAGGTMSGPITMGGTAEIINVDVIKRGTNILVSFEELFFRGYQGTPWSFEQQPTIPGYQTLAGGVNAANLTNLSAIAGSGLGVVSNQLVVGNDVTIGTIRVGSVEGYGDGLGRSIDFDAGSFSGSWDFSSTPTIPGFITDGTAQTNAVIKGQLTLIGADGSTGQVVNILDDTDILFTGWGITAKNLIGSHFGNASGLTNFPSSLLTVSQGNTNYWRITTAPTNATESGQRGQIAVSSSNVFIYNPDALGAGTGRWIRIQGSISWP